MRGYPRIKEASSEAGCREILSRARNRRGFAGNALTLSISRGLSRRSARVVPFPEKVSTDRYLLCHFPDSGKFLLLLWCSDKLILQGILYESWNLVTLLAFRGLFVVVVAPLQKISEAREQIWGIDWWRRKANPSGAFTSSPERLPYQDPQEQRRITFPPNHFFFLLRPLVWLPVETTCLAMHIFTFESFLTRSLEERRCIIAFPAFLNNFLLLKRRVHFFLPASGIHVLFPQAAYTWTKEMEEDSRKNS